MMNSPPRTGSIALAGPYDLREVALMSFGSRDEKSWDDVMRLAFCVDGNAGQVGVEVRQEGASLQLMVHDAQSDAPAPLETVQRQVARIVSADHDGDAWARVCVADPVLARLHELAPGFRPANFVSPYEAAVWAVLSARRGRAQGIALRRRLAEARGAVFDLAGRAEAALPTPGMLATLDEFPGVPADRIPRLHAIAEAAMSGLLDVDRLTAMTPEAAMAEVQKLPGIGPFYSALIVIRSCGLTDVLSTEETHSREAIRDLYGLDHLPTDRELFERAEAWRPFRTWAAVTLRALGSRLRPA